jgi:hypothetical protein
MKKTFSYSRKVRVPLDSYNSNEYFHSMSIEYNEEEMENQTVIDSVEFKSLQKEIDITQRRVIEDETGITYLPMDKIKGKERIKNKFKLRK